MLLDFYINLFYVAGFPYRSMPPRYEQRAGDNPTGDEIRNAIRSFVAKIIASLCLTCETGVFHRAGHGTEFKVCSISHTRVFLRSAVLHLLFVCHCEASSESLGQAHFVEIQSWPRKQIQSPLRGVELKCR